MEKRKRGRRLTSTEAVSRIDGMIENIEKNVLIALEVEAALESANKIIESEGLNTTQFCGAECYNTVSNCAAMFLALTLAKLFENPSARQGQTQAHRYNTSDVASIPIMVHFIQQKRCKKSLQNRARTWTPSMSDMEDVNAKTCAGEIDRAIERFAKLSRSRQGQAALQNLAEFRNRVFAHELLNVAVDALPRYNDLFLLVDVARDIANHAKLAIRGDNFDLAEVEQVKFRMSEAFWRPALIARST